VGARIKGVAFREFLRFCGDRLGRERITTVLQRIETPEVPAFDPTQPYMGVLPSTWYPAPLIHTLLNRITDGMSPAQRSELASSGATAIMDATLRGIYARLVALFVTPEIYAKHAPKLWQSYYDHGDFLVTIHEGRRAECIIGGWTAHHPLLCEMNVTAANRIYEAMRLAGVETVRESCVGAGGQTCRFVTRWA
jgi:hypothetical protein